MYLVKLGSEYGKVIIVGRSFSAALAASSERSFPRIPTWLGTQQNPIGSYRYRSVDELTTFYILRWVNNVFHILLKIWHIIVWFGPNCLGKSTPSFRTYDMIKNMPKCLSHHAFIIVKMYVVNRII